MSDWKIDPTGVQTVLTSVQATQGELATVITEAGMNGVMAGVAWGGGITAGVSEALAGLLTEQQSNVTAVGNTVNASVTGVANAVYAYNTGQEQMALEFQGAIADGSAGDFSFFEQHGYRGDA